MMTDFLLLWGIAVGTFCLGAVLGMSAIVMIVSVIMESLGLIIIREADCFDKGKREHE